MSYIKNVSIAKNIRQIEAQIDGRAKLVAVTKTKPISLLQEAYDAGCKCFGENKVQEMVEKQALLPTDIEWHLIGHLQTNKVKYMASFVSLVHSVDSLKLLQEINKQAAKAERVIDCLLQIHIAQEETKFGFSETEVETLLGSDEVEKLANVRIVGLMGMASNVADELQIRHEFRSLKLFFDKLNTSYATSFTILSMGMSGDYLLAIEEGSTLVRVGSAIFGSR
ncbi:MAG: YggS family pyridoxal phosphate-dependent enzyme [Runella slithyformis]|nr:MAG: YggS family pyridoxal phosphate-dependent enzyme [Runella slithyformis]TAF00249.1 MAG: YggS family pyridoxal phosphate-dependent enzyme [Runella slithyformis]TAF81438.1 MAG: YggS family pyridoxal phosphate-dependent enzyme [Runella slithyformis]